MARALLLAAVLLAAILLAGCALFPYGFPGSSRPNPNAPETPPPIPSAPSSPSTPSSPPTPSAPSTPSVPSAPPVPPVNGSGANESGPAINGSLPLNETNASIPAGPNASAPDEPNLANATPANMQIRYYSVGFGDATLIRGDNFTMLLDTGPAASSDSLSSSLAQAGVTHIDVLAITQWEAGKLGGLDSVFQRFSVGEVWVPTDAPESPTLQYASLSINQSDAPVRHVAAGDHFRYGHLAIEVFNPPKSPYSTSQDANSLVMRMKYGSFCAFFSGDLEEAQEAPVIPSLGSQGCKVYKAPYHGRGSAMPSLIFDRLKPSDVIISAGYNTAGLPSPTALTRFSIAKAKVWRTDSGDVALDAGVDGNYSIKTG